MPASTLPAATASPRSILARYAGRDGRTREVVTCRGGHGGLLVVDRDAFTLGDRRLLAALSCDEPELNAAIVCRRYLDDGARVRPRPLLADDLRPVGDREAATEVPEVQEPELGGPAGERYRLTLLMSRALTVAELRWVRLVPRRVPRIVSLREVIGAVESYEPARELTAVAVEHHRTDPDVSVAVLRAELERMARSRIVLNRGLREAVLRALAEEGVSMSRIAIRCGRIKHDRRGNLSGETSWLARRLGLAPEGGERRPTPWIHTDVLALIARAGLGIAPREVELG